MSETLNKSLNNNIWIPTVELRWLETDHCQDTKCLAKINILQQKWMRDLDETEWRDIEIVVNNS